MGLSTLWAVVSSEVWKDESLPLKYMLAFSLWASNLVLCHLSLSFDFSFSLSPEFVTFDVCESPIFLCIGKAACDLELTSSSSLRILIGGQDPEKKMVYLRNLAT